MTLERIVRPFQNDTVFSARILPPHEDQKDPPEPVVITVRSKANTNYVDEPPPGTLGFTSEWKEDRDRRVTDKVRVKNKDDPEQFVDVERIKSMVFRNTHTREEIPLNMDWNE